jgi:hypothetical protein
LTVKTWMAGTSPAMTAESQRVIACEAFCTTSLGVA